MGVARISFRRGQILKHNFFLKVLIIYTINFKLYQRQSSNKMKLLYQPLKWF